MDKQLKTVWQFIKANPITIGAIVIAVVVTVSTLAYSRNQSTSLQRKQVESEAKLAQAIDNSKKLKSEREKAEEEAKKKAEEAKATEELKLLEEKKATEEAAAIAAAAAKKQTTITVTDKKNTEQKTYETVSVDVAIGSGQVAASIGTTKPGTCYYLFKNTSVDPYEKSDTSRTASNGSCPAVDIPAGTWTKVYVSYKASDYSAKGDGYRAF